MVKKKDTPLVAKKNTEAKDNGKKKGGGFFGGLFGSKGRQPANTEERCGPDCAKCQTYAEKERCYCHVCHKKWDVERAAKKKDTPPVAKKAVKKDEGQKKALVDKKKEKKGRDDSPPPVKRDRDCCLCICKHPCLRWTCGPCLLVWLSMRVYLFGCFSVYLIRAVRGCCCALCFKFCPECMRFRDKEFPCTDDSVGYYT